MSLLHASDNKMDDAARGEDFAKGTSSLQIATVVAAVVVTVLIGIYIFVIATRPKPAFTGDVQNVWAYPLHTTTPGFDANGDPIPVENFDRMLVFANITLHNQSEHPLALKEVLTNVKLNDGIHSSFAASEADFQRLFVAYPQLKPLCGNPLNVAATLQPGETVAGTVFSSLSMTKEQFDARKDLNFSFAFRYQPLLVLTPKEPVQYPALQTPLSDPARVQGVTKDKQPTAASIFQ
jgi:hypothetical protein